jgi:hypothetical protein
MLSNFRPFAVRCLVGGEFVGCALERDRNSPPVENARLHLSFVSTEVLFALSQYRRGS